MQNMFPVWETDEQFWPKAAREYVFLGAAFHEVGKRLCGDEWTGREALTPQWPHRDAKRAFDDGVRLSRLPTPPRSLANWHSQSAPARKTEWTPPDPAKVAEATRARAERIATEEATNAALLERRLRVAGWIADHARNGRLATFGIARHWQPQALQPSLWFGEDDWLLFTRCETKRWLSAQSGVLTLKLFVSRADLDKCLASLAPPKLVGMASAEKRAEEWLRSEFAKPETLGTAKGPFKVEALALFPGLSGEGFSRAWGKASADYPERRNPGAKSKGQLAG